MEEIITKQEFDELMDIEGEGRGVLFKTALKFVLKEKGEEGVKMLERTMGDLGHPLEKIKAMDFYPAGLYAAMLIIIKRLFSFDDEKFVEMGDFESKISIIVRLFTKFFGSAERAVQQVPKVWRTYFSFGKIEVAEMDEEKGFAVFRIQDFSLHPLHCCILRGYFSSVVQMVVGRKTTCQELKCVHEGDNYHEFRLKW
ncbi:MAG: hypothetical protein GF370_03700 [Candidatus Nealsonbacteria bacterium]|nr:hypothetical protein [Candidatus Nealsonbacteria bacterium]